MDWCKIKVKDLINELKKFDPNWEIVLNCYVYTDNFKVWKDFVDTWDTQSYELEISNYEYEERNWDIKASKDIVLNFNVW